MFRDRTLIWIMEYVFGGALVLVPLIYFVLRRLVFTDAYNWGTQLFIVCLGVILISCASSMRQRLLLSKRIDMLAKQIENSAAASF